MTCDVCRRFHLGSISHINSLVQIFNHPHRAFQDPSRVVAIDAPLISHHWVESRCYRSETLLYPEPIHGAPLVKRTPLWWGAYSLNIPRILFIVDLVSLFDVFCAITEVGSVHLKVKIVPTYQRSVYVVWVIEYRGQTPDEKYFFETFTVKREIGDRAEATKALPKDCPLAIFRVFFGSDKCFTDILAIFDWRTEVRNFSGTQKTVSY